MTQKRTPLSLCGVSVGADLRPEDIIEAALADVRSPATFWWDSSMPSPVS